MAQIPVRMNTQGMAFPLLSQQSGRTVINGQGDLTYVPGLSADGDVPEDRGIPNVFYAHNVMPSSYGWQGVGYDVEYVAGSSGEFQQIKLVQGATISGDLPAASSLRTYIAKVADGTGDASLYYIDGGVWTPISNSPTFPETRDITTAYVNGYTYICIPFIGVHVFNVSTGLLISRPLNGLDDTTLEGVFSSNGYLLVWSSRRVLWSSVINVEDFVPSDVSGAGGGAIQEAGGAIVYCLSAQLGFIVFTDNNVVSGVYTANEDFPFEFKEVPSAGGIYSEKLVSNGTAAGYHYCFTTNGIQRITHTNSTTVLSNVSDFIGNRIFEDFNDNTNALEQEVLSYDMPRMVATVANRYVIVSYSKEQAGTFSHAIVIDAIQNRIGKLKIPHTQVFEFRSLSAGTSLDSRGTIAFLGPDGEVNTLNFDLGCQTTSAVLILGKLQFVHQRLLQLQEVELENVCPSGNFELIDIPSLDGKTFEPIVQGYERPEDDGKVLKRYYFSNVAKSHSLLFKGSFELLSILVWFNVHGRH